MKVLLALLVAVTFSVVTGEILKISDPIMKTWMDDQKTRVGATDTYVTIKDGELKGTVYTAVGGSAVYAYLGIPYAKAPLGELRFQPPQPFEDSWTPATRNAFLHPPACPQWLTNTTVADEDCLFVSVYTKIGENSTVKGPLPVMYWVHGGGFLLGQTSYYTASKLLQNDVVLVTVQYRMGPLGFLSTNDIVMPGNNGMKDMVQGMKWVKENIAAFGGDPNQVTVFGESAGGATATFMLISPLAQGLFHSAAAISGTALAEWSVDRDGRDAAFKLATALNCTLDGESGSEEESRSIVNCMQNMDWKTIAQTHFEMMLKTQGGELKVRLPGTSPVIEPDHPGAFLSREPLDAFENGPLPDVPLLLGANQHEGSFILAAADILRLQHTGVLDDPKYVHDKLIGDLLATWGVDETANGASISQALSYGFLPFDDPRTNLTTFQYELIDMLSVLFMKAPVLKTAEILSRRLPAVYLYSFEYMSRNSLWNFVPLIPIIIPKIKAPPFDGGITHADDLLFMFSLPMLPTATDLKFSKMWCELFTNFGTYRNPTPNATAEYPVWPKYDVAASEYMTILPTPKVSRYYPTSWKQGMYTPEP